MKIDINEVSLSEREINVNLEYNEIKNEIDEAYKKERRNISHPGFRKGKVPINILKKLYGDSIEYKASEEIANKKFWDIVKSEELKPISTPQLIDINFEAGSKLFFKVKYEVKPKLSLKDYNGLEVKKPVFKVRDEDIEKEIESLIKSNATFEDAEEVDGKNYKITVNLQRLDENDTPIDGSRSDNLEIDLSDPQVNPQIFQNANGKKIGEDFNFRFVDEHQHGEEKHREEFNYTASIKKITKMILPEPDEKLIKKLSQNKSSTMQELKSQIKENFEKYYNQQSQNIFQNSLLGKVVENNDFQAPSGFVETVLNKFVEAERENATRSKVPFNEKEVTEQLKPKAEWNAKWQIIMENIASEENINVKESELKEIAKKEAEQIGISVDKLLKYYKDTNREEALLEEKVVKFLEENSKVIEFDPDKKEKNNPDEEVKKSAKKKTSTKKKTTKQTEKKEKS